MYVENVKVDFYDFLTGKVSFVVMRYIFSKLINVLFQRILLLVHYDIDGICACKILQNLLQYKDILYTLSVVRGVEDLKGAYQENCNDVKYFVFINCGGTVNIVDLFEPADDAVFFIVDSHRPTHLDNIYSDGQVRLLWTPEEDADVPEFNTVYRDDVSSHDMIGVLVQKM